MVVSKIVWATVVVSRCHQARGSTASDVGLETPLKHRSREEETEEGERRGCSWQQEPLPSESLPAESDAEEMEALTENSFFGMPSRARRQSDSDSQQRLFDRGQ